MTEQSKTEINLNHLSGKKIVIWTSILTPTLLILSIFFMGGGHGTYFFGKLFFPIPMIIAGINDRITDLAAWIAVLQIPIYGLSMYSVRHKKWKIVGLGILLIHISLFFVAMTAANGFD
ncbi:hypothetical protein [Aureivirga sp. CE67]|uniref:hypothetical protein n=1 Tax=Aureivirga sp. CE67 TaxID=1788983 RepID=UPI0018CAE223|nr:hypothetical protein [Aureivirga sp. CE67]